MIQTSIVKIRLRDSVAYELRWTDQDGVECEVFATRSLRQAQRVSEIVEKMAASPDAGVYAVQMSAALLSISQIATRISQSSDTQGAAGYATKAHMRQWADEITDAALGAISMIKDLGPALYQFSSDARESGDASVVETAP